MQFSLLDFEMSSSLNPGFYATVSEGHDTCCIVAGVALLCVIAQLVFHTSGMRREWSSLEMRCSFESVAEQISSKVCLCAHVCVIYGTNRQLSRQILRSDTFL